MCFFASYFMLQSYSRKTEGGGSGGDVTAAAGDGEEIETVREQKETFFRLPATFWTTGLTRTS